MVTRNEQLPEGHPLQCSYPQCRTRRHVAKPVPACLRHYAALRRATLPPDPLLLPDDEIVDDITVEILTQGWRVVRATWVERALATARIVTQDHEDTVQVVADRLGLTPEVAFQLVTHVRGAGNMSEMLSVPAGNMSTTNPPEGS
jgi:hypothetical protein